MPFNRLKQWLPDATQLRRNLYNQVGCAGKTSNAWGRWVRNTFAEPAVWHMNRKSVAGGVAVGLFVSWVPIPMQMLLAAIISAAIRVHVPVSVVMVWFTNPLTFAPLFYAAWQSGSMILGKPVLSHPINLSMQGLWSSVSEAWPTIAVGMLFCACVTAVLGFALTLLVWRIHAIRRWRERRHRHLPTS